MQNIGPCTYKTKDVTRNHIQITHDGLSRINDTSHEEFEALIGEYFDDDESDVESECGKESIKLFIQFTHKFNRI